MDGLKIPNKIKSQVLGMWETNQDSAIGKIREYERAFEIQDAKFAIMEARNYSITNRLYLSDLVFSKISETSSKMISLHSIHLFPDRERGGKDGSEISSLTQEISLLIEEITKLMRDEITMGYYKQ